MRYWYSSGTVTGVTYAVTDHSIAAGATSFRDAKATASLTNFGFDAMNPPNYGTFGIPGFYINGNIATFGEFAAVDPGEFHGPLKREGDATALRDFETLFLGK